MSGVVARPTTVLPITSIDHLKYNHLVKKYNFVDTELTIDTVLAYAIQAEKTCNDLGVFDPAFTRFKEQQLDFERLALLIEQLNPFSTFHSPA